MMTRRDAPPTAREIRVLATTRLSDDPQGDRKEHAAQRRAITALQVQQGWPPIRDEDWFCDTDASASKEDVVRDEWERLLATLAGIDRRAVEVIVVGYKQDRMMRQLGDPQKLANLIERKRGQLWTAKEGQLSVSKGGRAALYFNGAVAALEPEATAGRAMDGMFEAAINGKAHGPVGYGWTRVYEAAGGTGKPVGRQVLHPEQAKIVCELAHRVLAGESLRGIAADLNARGVPAPNAGKVRRRDKATREALAFAASTWNPAKVRQILLRKANIKIRVYTTGTGEDAETTEYKAKWDPILDEDTYTQVVAVLSAPERRTSRTNVARHWLSTIALCGVCMTPVTVQSVGQKGKKYAAYRCSQAHVTKAEVKTDAVVEEAVLEILSRPGVRAALERGDGGASAEAVEKAATLRAELATLEEDRLALKITREEYLRMNARWKADLAAAEAVLARRRDSVVYADLVRADNIGKAWEATPLGRRRAVVAAVAKVVLHKNTKRGRGAFDSETIKVTACIPTQ